MAEKKEYRSAVRSRRFIRQSFMELLKEKRLEKITVTDIVNRADINRSTFYAHYTDVRALVEEIQQEVVERSIALLRETDFMELLCSPVPFLKKLVDIANENRELYILLGKHTFAVSQIERMKRTLVEKAMAMPQIPEEIRQTKKFEIRIHFFVGGIINVYQQFLMGTLDATTDEIIADIADIIQASSAEIRDTKE